MYMFQVKHMFQNVVGQTDSLKGMWTAKMNMKGAPLLATETDLAEYDRKLHFLEEELERRREVGHRFEAILKRQEDLAEDDEKHREAHQVWCAVFMKKKNQYFNSVKFGFKDIIKRNY